MPESLGAQLLHTDLEVPCPSCTYSLWVLWSEVAAQCIILCPCCRDRVHLIDDRGSMSDVGNQLESEIERMVRGLF